MTEPSKNFKSRQDLPWDKEPFASQKVFDGYDFSMPRMRDRKTHVEAFDLGVPGDGEGYTFRNCDLNNRVLPSKATIENCSNECFALGLKRSNQAEPNIDGVDDIRQSNFSYENCLTVDGQKVAHPFGADATGKRFSECNFVNRIPPEGATFTHPNTTIKETMVIVDYDEVTIDGETIQTPIYANIVYGIFNHVTREYEYFPEPKVYPKKPPAEEGGEGIEA